MLDDHERRTLLAVARERIESHLYRREPRFPPRGKSLDAPAGAFVTLHLTSEGRRVLRGCIGCIQADQPLYDTVLEMAFAAAFRDPRFAPLTESELGAVDLEISVLSIPGPVADASQVEPGRHGIIIEQRGRSGLLLPQVAAEHGWDRTTFLEQTCRKARLPADAWKHPETRILVFTAEVFGEV